MAKGVARVLVGLLAGWIAIAVLMASISVPWGESRIPSTGGATPGTSEVPFTDREFPPEREDLASPVIDDDVQPPIVEDDPLPVRSGCDPLPSFASEADLLAQLENPPSSTDSWDSTGGFGWSGVGTATAAGGDSSLSFSSTNNQVAGVDEPDLVKTDGHHLFIANGSAVHILSVSSPTAPEIVGTIRFEGYGRDHSPYYYPSWYWGQVLGLFLKGDRLVVLRSDAFTTSIVEDIYGYANPRVTYHPLTQALIYDVSDPAAPTLLRNLTASGSFVAARMIGEHVYLVTSATLFQITITVEASGYYDPIQQSLLLLPAIWVDGVRTDLTYRDIAPLEDSRYSRRVALLAGFGIRDTAPPTYDAVVTNYRSTVYMSSTNLYIAGNAEWWWGGASGMNTTIHKFAAHEGRLCYIATGQVPGSLINQFAMDEHGGHLRVVTSGRGLTWGDPVTNGVYVLDPSMVVVGRLEGLATGETVFAARFLGGRAYVVTFRRIDPLFILDVSDPQAPTVLGELEIPGFSTYLHPFDETHLLGVGRASCTGTDLSTGCVKVSLFDVSNPARPTEAAKYVVASTYYSWSAAETDHHAFLFIPARGLVVLPVTEGYDASVQGALVLSVSLTDGIQLKATITHQDAADCLQESSYGYSWYSHFCKVNRSMFVGDVLYTISPAFVKAHSLEDFAHLLTLRLE